MQYDMRELPVHARYKLLTSSITPRPIAWVSTVSADGVRNVAPYSFFNAMGDDPPMLALGLLKHHATGAMKDTATNIMATGEFVVNLVCEADAAAMVQTSVDCPADVDEVDYARLEMAPSSVIKPERIATSPVSFECRKIAAIDIGPRQTVILGEVLITHIRDEFILDAKKLYLDTPAMKLIGRTHGSGWYVRNGDAVKHDRVEYDPAR